MTKTTKQPTIVDLLNRTREIVEHGWTRGYYARTRSGVCVGVENPAAARFCLLGATFKARRDLDLDSGMSVTAEWLYKKCIVGGNVPLYNDAPERKKSEIIAVIDCAIKKAKEAQ